MDQEQNTSPAWRRRSIAIGLIGVGLILGIVAFDFGLLPLLMHVKPMPSIATGIIGGFAAICIVLGLLKVRSLLDSLEDAELLEEPKRSQVLHSRYLVGVGFAMLADAIICSITVVALAWITGRARLGLVTSSTGQEVESNLIGDGFNAAPLDHLEALGASGSVLDQLGPFFGRSANDAFFVAALFTLSTLVALLGALFFFATSLWSKLRDEQREPFERPIFWAGLWFRIGEAVLFNIVFFLLLRYYAPDQYLALPLVSLFVGMFLKAGEKLVSGLANRVIEAFAALVPAHLEPPPHFKALRARPPVLPTSKTERATMLGKVALAVGELVGVNRAVVDAEDYVVVEYDASKVTSDRIRREMVMAASRSDNDEPGTDENKGDVVDPSGTRD